MKILAGNEQDLLTGRGGGVKCIFVVHRMQIGLAIYVRECQQEHHVSQVHSTGWRGVILLSRRPAETRHTSSNIQPPTDSQSILASGVCPLQRVLKPFTPTMRAVLPSGSIVSRLRLLAAKSRPSINGQGSSDSHHCFLL